MVPCWSQYSKRTSRTRNIPGVEQTKKWNRANILYSCSYTLYWGLCVMWKYRLPWDYIGFWRLHILWCIYLMDIDGNKHPKSLYNNDDDWYQQERLYNCQGAYEIFCNIYPSQFSLYIYVNFLSVIIFQHYVDIRIKWRHITLACHSVTIPLHN